MRIRLFDAVAIILSLTVFLLFSWYGVKRDGDTGYLVVEDNTGEYLYPLSEDRDILLEGPVGESLIRIENGRAGFAHSDCEDSLCVQMGTIGSAGEWAACLPNQIFIHTSGMPEEQEVDAGVY